MDDDLYDVHQDTMAAQDSDMWNTGVQNTYKERALFKKRRVYSKELRERIAISAISNGIMNTVRKFSLELGHALAESTVRTMRASYMNQQTIIQQAKK